MSLPADAASPVPPSPDALTLARLLDGLGVGVVYLVNGWVEYSNPVRSGAARRHVRAPQRGEALGPAPPRRPAGRAAALPGPAARRAGTLDLRGHRPAARRHQHPGGAAAEAPGPRRGAPDLAGPDAAGPGQRAGEGALLPRGPGAARPHHRGGAADRLRRPARPRLQDRGAAAGRRAGGGAQPRRLRRGRGRRCGKRARLPGRQPADRRRERAGAALRRAPLRLPGRRRGALQPGSWGSWATQRAASPRTSRSARARCCPW